MDIEFPHLQHTFFSEMKSVREIESDLSHLMKEFEAGRMQAFGDPDMISRMDNIRQMQEKLAQKHFCLDDMDTNPEGKDKIDIIHDRKKTQELMQDLDVLTTELQQLKPVPILESMLLSSSSSLLNKPRSIHQSSTISVQAKDISQSSSPIPSLHASYDNLPLLNTSKILYSTDIVEEAAKVSISAQPLTKRKDINEAAPYSQYATSLLSTKANMSPYIPFDTEKQPLL